jgi:hypothetical protein
MIVESDINNCIEMCEYLTLFYSMIGICICVYLILLLATIK